MTSLKSQALNLYNSSGVKKFQTLVSNTGVSVVAKDAPLSLNSLGDLQSQISGINTLVNTDPALTQQIQNVIALVNSADASLISPNIFSTLGSKVHWNGTLWVAVGEGTNTIAYSTDGKSWTPVTVSSNIFTSGKDVTWNGTRWVAVGNGSTYQIAYSSDGKSWNGSSSNIFSRGEGVGVASNINKNSVYIQQPTISVGTGDNTIAYSPDGISWTGLGKDVFSDIGYSVAWNGEIWVAVGTGGNEISHSTDGINWTPVTGDSASIFTSAYAVEWNGIR
jgi:hypothetical protein